MLDDHRHRRILCRSQLQIACDVERSFAARAFLQLERVFLLQPDVLQVAAAYLTMKFIETLLQKCVIEEITLQS